MDDPSHRGYRMLNVLGQGAFGTVYRAELRAGGGFRKEVAVKLLHKDYESKAGNLERLRDEARLLGMLHHRAIVGVDSLIQLDSRWAVIMEYVPGLALDELLASHGPLPLSIALETGAQIASALHAAHHATGPGGKPLRLVHRDVKPANIRLTPHGELKLLDFGVALAEFADREAKTQSMTLGSVRYMSPERLTGHDTPSSDVYALAISLVELLTGELPAGLISASTSYAGRVHTLLDRVDRVYPSPELHELLDGALAWSPSERPTAKEFERATVALRREAGAPWLPEWAEETLPPLMERPPVAGDDTGRTLLETQHDAPLQLTRGNATFDSLTESPSPPPPPPEVETTWVDPAPLEEPAPTPADPPPPAPQRFSLLHVLTVGLVLCALAAAGALGLFTLGGGAMIGGAVLAVTPWASREVCLDDVDDVRQDLVDHIRGPGVSHLHTTLDQLRKECVAGRQGMTASQSFKDTYEALSADGQVSLREAQQLRSTLR